jgi:hypothetical protein
MARIKYRSAEVWERRRLFAKRMTLIFGALIILIIVGVVLLLRIGAIQIKETNIEGANIIDKNEIQNTVDESLSGNYLWVIPKSNTFLYSVKKLNSTLIQRFPGISTLSISRVGFKKISIKIGERKPEALWCSDAKEGDVPECYFVDNSGIVFARAPFFSGNVYFMYRGKLDKEDPLGAQIFTVKDFLVFQAFIKQTTNKLGISIVGAELKEQGDFDLLLSSGVRILLNRKMSYDDIYNNMFTIIKSKEFSSSTSTLNSLDYIDMRFGNKIFYKAKIGIK